MKVWILCKEPFPLGMAATKRILCYAKALVSGGVECEVIAFKRHETGGKRTNLATSGIFEGVPFRYAGLSTRKPKFKLPRLLTERIDFLSLKRILRNGLRPGDVVLGYFIAEVDETLQIIDLVHERKAKYVRELCEIPFFGGLSNEAQSGFKRTMEEVFPKLDGVIAISEALSDLAAEHLSPSATVLKIPILVDFEQYSLPDRSSSERVPFIFHSGTLYEQKDGVLGLIEAFALAKKKYGRPLKYIFAGDLDKSPQKEEILALIKKYDLAEDIIFKGYLKPEECNEYLSRAALVILNKHENPQNIYGFSTKLGEYLAAGKCVVMTDVGEALNWLQDGKNAIIVPKEDCSAIADAAVRILSDPDAARELGKNGREICCDNFDWRRVSDKLCKFVKSL